MGFLVALALLAQAAAPSGVAALTDVQHTPIEKATRGQGVRISATIKNQTSLLTPLVFARKPGMSRYHGYPMIPRGTDKYQARLPASFASGKTFEYFIEVRHENGEIKSIGSAQKPYSVEVVEPKVLPAKLMVVSDEGATVSVDGLEIGKSGSEVEVAPGKHTIAVVHSDGRGAETQVEMSPGRSKKITLPLPRAGGPGTLTLLSEPAGAHVALDEQALGLTPFQGDIQPGKHKLTIEKEGYVRQEREVLFREGHDVELSFALAVLPKDPALAIESVPAGAQVFIDGKQVGVAPWLGPLEAGRHQVVLKKQGRREVASDFEMPSGRDLSMRLELPAPTSSNAPRVVVTSKPDGATVLVDGVEVGQTPWAGAVKAGKRKLTVQMAGFVSEEREVNAAQNREMEVSFALGHVAGPARVVIETDPSGASLEVDGEDKGKSPATLSLAPGEHEIIATSAGFKGVSQKISVDNGQQASLRLALAPAAKKPESILAIATDPKGARLYVDGRLIGETPRKVKTTPGQHEVRVALDGFITRSAKVSLPPGKDFELRIAVSLKRVRGEEKRAGPDERVLARARLKRAQSCDKQGDWDCALKYFQAVYDYKPVPELLFNIAQVRRKKGDFKEAALAYRAYLKEKPTGQLSTRAEQLAKRCEEVAAGGEKNVTEDDTEPPVIAHSPVPKALRGVPLKLSAVITDDKSGVFNPQACWRNVYNTEYECAPLVLVGQDTYAVEVPAKAVTDGFAYFVEAFDNASNGPARSGAPEVPHSVAVEDPAPPPVAALSLPEIPKKEGKATAEAEASGEGGSVKPLASAAVDEALSGKSEKAEEPGHKAESKAELAAHHEIVQGAGTSGEQPSHGALGNQLGGPGASLGGQVVVRQPEAAPLAQWFLLVHLGAESATERYTDSVVDGRAGVELSRRLFENQLALLSMDARTVRQPYRQNVATPGSPNSTSGIDEQRYDVRLGYGYDFGSKLVGADRLVFALLGVAEYQRWQNPVYPANYFGLGFGAQARLLLAGPFAVVGGSTWTFNTVKNTNANAVGTPRNDLAVRGGMEMAISERHSLEITYRGDLLTLSNDYRFTNGVSVGFGTAF